MGMRDSPPVAAARRRLWRSISSRTLARPSPTTRAGRRIAAALPLDPDSEAARGFVREWSALLAPFRAVATPEMWAGATRLHQKREQWEGQADPGFSAEVWQFIQAASAAMQARGGEPKG